MTIAQLRNHPDQAVAADAEIVLDWFAHHPGSTIRTKWSTTVASNPPPIAADFLRFAGAIFCLDRKVERSAVSDSWTRDLELHAYVEDADRWESNRPLLVAALEFLTGDNWNLSFSENTHAEGEQLLNGSRDRVSLFSGGLDSLIGAIDQLEDGERVALVGHHDSPFTDSRQTELFRELKSNYGPEAVSITRLFLRPHYARQDQFRPLPLTYEPSSRSRSIVFIAAGMFIASTHGEHVPLTMPENGFISINVPLTSARVGSLSTRTTHPRFIGLLGQALAGLGLSNPIENPYGLATKGEMLVSSRNPAVLNALAPRSISCSHPEQSTRRKLPPMNCGYCYPCLIRRAAFHAVGLDDGDDYEIDVLEFDRILDPYLKSGQSTRALLTSLNQPLDPMAIIRNGPLPDNLLIEVADLFVRGRDELREWISTGRTDPPYAGSRLV